MAATTEYCIALVLLCATIVEVTSNYDFTVQFYEYWNPTGLCGECGENGVPVCCDDILRITNCLNMGQQRCDTRFRFIQRPYGASVETAPTTNYQDFTLSVTNKNHETFNQGPRAFLTLANPYTRTNTTAWTGRIQLHIDALDVNNDETERFAIIDRISVNLQLQLGANFTDRESYVGIYNISQLAMSFKVECSAYYYGPDCTTFCKRAEGQYNCDSNGRIECMQANYDPSNGCIRCLPGWDLSTNCTKCLSKYDPSTNCTSCMLPEFDPSNNCSLCLISGNDPSANCTRCLPGRDPMSNCTSCLFGYNPSANCLSCLQGRDQAQNCTTCLPGWDEHSNCTECLQHYDPESNCTQCLPGRDPEIQCKECLPGRDPLTNCRTCYVGYDITTNCSTCLLNRNIFTDCIKCFPGYIGDNCIQDPCISCPCKNDGSCTPNTTTGEYLCQCASGFEGQNCTTKVKQILTKLEIILGATLGASVLINIVVVLILFCRCLPKCSSTTSQGVSDLDDAELRNNAGYGVHGGAMNELTSTKSMTEGSYYNVDILHSNGESIQHRESIYEHIY